MLQIEHISKQYTTGDLTQTALKEVSLNLRDNEFVAILGPSGSGKTTLLNIIGGLDRYDSGDLIINGISTKEYEDRDWDSYRNHTIGFVFQSYNLIPHQTVLANVELALTISGISKSERRKRAAQALDEVGLGDQLHKKPNQMSGGQMQRVAIARALVNNPDILLADEPTGALDTETSVQIMELLKGVAKDRLVVMVTHNPELAETYATRIVKLRDGKIISDSAPFELDTTSLNAPKYQNMGKSSMSFRTSLSLSFNNLRTKKTRTLLTAFAGSIGIIGIALILALSNGVNIYITDIQKSTMTAYPISIQEESIDMTSMLGSVTPHNTDKLNHALDGVYSNGESVEKASQAATSIVENNLTAFKKYLVDPDSEISQYVGENGIVYSYDTKFSVYTYDSDDVLLNTDGSTLSEGKQAAKSAMGDMTHVSEAMGNSSKTTENFEELIPGSGEAMISTAITDSYDVLYGAWPSSYDELVLILDENNEISTETLYELGILPSSAYDKLMEKIADGKKVKLETESWSYEEICKQDFYLLPACAPDEKHETGTFDAISEDKAELKSRLQDAVKLKITGIIRPKEDAASASLSAPLGYTKALTDYLIDYTDDSAVVKAQKKNKKVNVLSGMTFDPGDDDNKVADAKTYLENLGVSEKAKLAKEILQSVYSNDPARASQMMAMGEEELASALDSYLQNPEDDVLLSIYDNYISSGSYDDNLSTFGVVSLDAPSAINIYTDSFEDKDAVSGCIESYNQSVKKADQITYTDYAELLMSSVTTIINIISYVLIAFVAVSLLVSSIMIGIITYISVLERTKEIGILRAIGASKRNITQVFNAETFIVGLCSGGIGIAISLLLLIPGNAAIHALTDTTDVNAALPAVSAIILIVLSVLLTLIGGFIPSKNAAKKDPVAALRTE